VFFTKVFSSHCVNEKRRESWKPLHLHLAWASKCLAGWRIQTTSSYLSDSTLLWNENQAYVFVSFETVACSNGLAKRSLGHPLVEARCDGFQFEKKKRKPKRPHLRVNLVLHKCFRSSHRQGCSPHSPLREMRNKSTSRLFRFSPQPFNHKWGSGGGGSTHYLPGSSIRLEAENSMQE